MKMKRFALPLALIMAGTIALGAGCGETESAEPPAPVVTVQDGYVYVDGAKTEIQVNPAPADSSSEEPEQKSAFELWKENNSAYTGTEAEWLAWLEKIDEEPEVKTAFELWKETHASYTGTEDDWLAYLEEIDKKPEEKEEMTEYKIIENGSFRGSVTAGTATTENSKLKLSGAELRLRESVVLSIGENAAWSISITGTLLTGSSTGAQLLAGNPFSEFGRVYLGVNKSSGMLYLGVRLNTVYVNYGWKLDNAAKLFAEKHSYELGYENGNYFLSLDGGAKLPMSDINFNQTNASWLDGTEADSQNLNELIRTVLAQDYIEMTNIGTNGFACNAEIESFTVKSSAIGGYRRLLAHPLSDTKIFYLGSSITYGSASNGVAFGDILSKITGNPYAKEAVSGTTLVDNGSSSYVQRLRNGALDFEEKPDYLVVQLSTNDFSQGKPLGTVQDGTKSSDFDTSTVSGAIQYIIAYAKEQCPTVKVVFYVGAVRSSWGNRTAYENYVNGDFKTICEKWEIEPLDIFHSKYKSYSCFWSDDIHPTVEGYSAGWTPLFMKYFTDRL